MMNFAVIRREDYYYVDKTDFIRQVIEEGSLITLLPRPRRFGKTLNQFMIRRFFEDERSRDGEKIDNGYLFDGLVIADCGEELRKHQQQYPVIFLSMKSARQPDFEDAYKKLCGEIAEEYRRHQYLLKGNSLTEEQKTYSKRLWQSRRTTAHIMAH